MATSEDLRIRGTLDLFISNSNEPSNTIRMRPTVPKIGKTGFKFGTEKGKPSDSCFAINPRTNNRITDGILVLEADISKT